MEIDRISRKRGTLRLSSLNGKLLCLFTLPHCSREGMGREGSELFNSFSGRPGGRSLQAHPGFPCYFRLPQFCTDVPPVPTSDLQQGKVKIRTYTILTVSSGGQEWIYSSIFYTMLHISCSVNSTSDLPDFSRSK